MLLNYIILILQIVSIILLFVTINNINSMNEINECLSLDMLNKYYLTEEEKKKLKTKQV
jgi:hypothetical protein